MKALIAMSGGLDSSVAALIMKNNGYECIGCTMKLREDEEDIITGDKSCCSEDDISDARSVAQSLGMKYYVFNFKDEFKEKVIENFVGCYLRGETPNPCIDCNAYLKFGKLHLRAKELGCDYVVTGHYARIEEKDGKFYLKEGSNLSKDQSYVLYRMTQEQLSHTKFPLGDMDKEYARKLAEENGLRTAHKKDSQDICFVPDGDYASVVEKYSGSGSISGDFVDMQGNVLGTHKGIIHYTLGQRKGLGIAAKAPLYVVRIDVENNKVILGSNEELFSDSLTASCANWTLGEVPSKSFEAQVRVRYHGKKTPAVVTPTGPCSFSVKFLEPVRAITPGQAAVIYKDDIVLGGGVIQ